MVGYVDQSRPEVAYNKKVNPDFVMVSVPALADAVFEGIDRHLVYLFESKERGALAESRFCNLLTEIPFGHPDL